MPSIKSQIKLSILVGAATILMSGCMSKDVAYTDQQKRMMRCDQYIGESREECLRGMAVTIEDYKADWREFERDEKKSVKKKTRK
jgi:hypothetical protein